MASIANKSKSNMRKKERKAFYSQLSIKKKKAKRDIKNISRARSRLTYFDSI